MPCDDACSVVVFRSTDHRAFQFAIPVNCIEPADAGEQAIRMVKSLADSRSDSCPGGCECQFDGDVESDANLVGTRTGLVRKVSVPSRNLQTGEPCQISVHVAYTLKKFRVRGECFPKRDDVGFKLTLPGAGLAATVFPVDVGPGGEVRSLLDVQRLDESTPV
jgi:hypothetical protein